jgi:hypothetical protein
MLFVISSRAKVTRITMNQHSIQKAYLKKFAAPGGRVWVYSKNGGEPTPEPPGKCASEEDFQSDTLEFYQQKVIESPGIKALRVNGSLSDDEFEQMSMWMGLHIVRTEKARQQLFASAADYERRFRDELRKERQFSAYYRYAYTHLVAEPNFVVTSDDPVVEFWCEDFLMRACAVSPQKLIFFSPREGKFGHELPLHDFFNAMMWGSPGQRLYSHRADLRVDDLKENALKYDIRAVVEDLQFEVMGGADVP